MKQEDKDLLLKDLCARLPYGVIVEYGCKYEGKDLGEKKSKLTGRMIDSFFGSMPIGMTEVYSLQPYLRPMSSMTEEEKKELSARWLWARCFDNINLAYLCDSAKDYVACSSGEYFELQDWLNKHHFDYRGLIGKGLAIEAPKGMYNEIRED